MASASINDKKHSGASEPGLLSGMGRIERREWWLWCSAVLVTLLLTTALISFVLSMAREEESSWFQVTHSMQGLVGLVLLFDIYVIYQQLQIYRIRRQLIQREELFRLITENAADMIAVIDADGRRIYNSPSYERVLGYNPEEMRLTPATAQVHPEDRQQVEDAAQSARATGVGRRIEYRMRHKDGSWRFLESTARTILDEEGNPGKLVIVNRDITDRKGLEEQFRQSQKMEAVGRLSGGIAHDFNNILGVIIGYGEILQERMEASHPLASCVEEILGAGRRAASLTRQLLAFSRQQVLKPKVLDLNGIIADTEKMLRRLIGEDVELRMVLDSSLTTVKADQGQIEQVILNLCVNARDAMPSGGKVTIKIENTVIDEVAARQYRYPFKPGPYVLLSVTDTGVGMDTATQAHIFEPFFTTKEKGKGTGLGLATVYGIVKQSDGYIEVHSGVNLGTTFKIYLPRVDEPVDAEKDSPSAASSLHGAETVLLVEDEDSLRTLTHHVLTVLGYTVLEASNGEAACLVSAQHPGTIDLVLTDVIMPGMNGPALAQQLGISRAQMKVLYMSGHTGQAVGHGVLPAGSNFLAKPFTRNNLAQKVREALGSKAVAHSENLVRS
jgi:two-component system, cell cycle sensor histidine kinase and response regulator CckA